MEIIPTVTNVRRRNGIAGQIEVTCKVRYEDADESPASFVGSTYGGSVVAFIPGVGQVRVSDPGRFGAFEDDPEGWVRRYYGQ